MNEQDKSELGLIDIFEYSQGVCGDGGAILRNGKQITIEEIIGLLREHERMRQTLIVLGHLIKGIGIIAEKGART